MKSSTALVMLVTALVIASVLFLKIYIVRDGVGATLFSRGDEAYLFLGSSHTGYQCRVLNCALEIVLEYFHAVTEPSDRSAGGIVLHVTPYVIERHLMKFDRGSLSTTGFLTPFEDGFYALCSGSLLCKWNGDGFRPATSEEDHSHGGVEGLMHENMNDQVIHGWSVHLVLPKDHSQFNIGNKFVISTNNLNAIVGGDEDISINLSRPNQAIQTLYRASGASRRVSKSEYEQYFGKH